jgi:hypothetical protein
MKLFATALEIQPVAPSIGNERPAVGLQIKLLNSSPPEFDLVLDTSAEAEAAIEAVGRFFTNQSRGNSPLHLLQT